MEHYSSAHAETVEELLEWPWLRMERFYGAFLLRITVERMERQQDLVIASLHANSVFDENKEASREEAVRSVESQFQMAIERVRAAAAGELIEDEDEDDYDESNPFFAAAERGMQRMGFPRLDEGESGKAADLVEGEHAAEDVVGLIRNLDQT